MTRRAIGYIVLGAALFVAGLLAACLIKSLNAI